MERPGNPDDEGQTRAGRDCLLVVDVQNDFMPGGALAVPDGDAVVPVVNRLMDGFDHVIVTQDWHTPGHLSFASSHPGRQPFETVMVDYGEQILWPDHCIQGTDGARFHKDFDTSRAELIIRKGFHRNIDSYSAIFENDHKTPTGLAGYLRERGFERLFIAGLATDFCVKWSVEDARRAGFETVMIEDGCRAIDIDGSARAALEAMEAAGATIATSETLPDHS